MFRSLVPPGVVFVVKIMNLMRMGSVWNVERRMGVKAVLFVGQGRIKSVSCVIVIFI